MAEVLVHCMTLEILFLSRPPMDNRHTHRRHSGGWCVLTLGAEQAREVWVLVRVKRGEKVMQTGAPSVSIFLLQDGCTVS